jgi:hypothetical protein
MKMHGARGEEVAKVRRSAKDASAASELAFYRGHQEIVFVEEGPTDGTREEIRRVMERYPERDIKFLYPLSRGFHQRSLCPLLLWAVLERLERLLNPMSRFLAFRLFIVLEKGL